jgi:regulator of CtrA degradation
MSVDEKQKQSSAVAIGPRIVASSGFDALYREGMALIEDVAAYLDGDGRGESRELAREASFVYATESMRLTTRLMQLASWLLLQRAVNE